MLTLNQQKAYTFICQFIQEHGHSPTLPDIAKGMGIRSKGHAHRYVQALINQGLVVTTPGRHRGIRLAESETASNDDYCLPLVGKIAAGRPIEAITQYQTINLNVLLGGRNRYVLKVVGDSMIDDGIFDGDLVICEQCNTAGDGAIVVALIDHQETTLKRLKRNLDATITLIPANHRLAPMVYSADRVQIQGVFVGLVRMPGV